MSTITLTLAESEVQLISGVPEYVTFGVSAPSTVFYTLDGTTPDETSFIADGFVYLPTDSISFELKAIAISSDCISDILQVSYYTDQGDIDRARMIGDEGINIFPAGSTPSESLSFDHEGNEAQESYIEMSELDIKTSKTSRLGFKIGDDSSVSFVNFPDAISDSKKPFQGRISSPNNNESFDPSAGLIIIDGSTDELFRSQSVVIINRSSGTFDARGDHWNDHLKERPIVSGNKVTSFYNPRNGKYVSYYYESRENRWIESIQSVNIGVKNLTPTRVERHVFRWIDSRHLSKLF
tara:strand:+ start:45570 stop:46454 length:885 start_codon:yes stop_codon:yes gene_type:complete